MVDVYLQYVDAVNVKVIAEPSIIMELSEHFTYFAKDYKFNPKYKARMWDGKIRLLKGASGYIYAGLAKKIKKWCDARSYTIEWDEELFYENLSEHEVKEFIKSLNIPDKYESRDYQLDSIVKCLRSKRRLLLSPTSSGKSMMIYIISQWYAKRGEKGLIIVPSIGLVNQMTADFYDYGFTGTVHKSTDGLSQSNDIEADVVITTWQSLNNGKTKMPDSWYKQFGYVFGDEAHGAKATCFIQIMSSLTNCKYRFGTTGTLDDVELNNITIEGLFGPQYKSISTREMMDQGYSSKLLIKCIVLKYDEQTCKEFHKSVYDPKAGKKRKKTYQEEIDFIINNEKRNKFIKNLTLSLEGNKLLFFRLKAHGKILHDLIKSESKGKVLYIDGGVDGDDREGMRHTIEDEDNATLIASLGTTSTGVSINKLHHMISAAPMKAKIKLLQSIGRMLRKHDTKETAYMYDIVDDLSHGSNVNYALNHFKERAKIYDNEKFEYKIYTVKL